LTSDLKWESIFCATSSGCYKSAKLKKGDTVER